MLVPEAPVLVPEVGRAQQRAAELEARIAQLEAARLSAASPVRRTAAPSAAAATRLAAPEFGDVELTPFAELVPIEPASNDLPAEPVGNVLPDPLDRAALAAEPVRRGIGAPIHSFAEVDAAMLVAATESWLVTGDSAFTRGVRPTSRIPEVLRTAATSGITRRTVAAGFAAGGIAMLVSAGSAVVAGPDFDPAALASSQTGLSAEFAAVDRRLEQSTVSTKAIAQAKRSPVDGLSPRRRSAIRSLERTARIGHAVAKVSIPKIGLAAYVVEGTGADSLARGPGHYPTTSWPGAGGTVGLAGHRTTHGAPFNRLDQLRKGSEIDVKMSYGTFHYKVVGKKVVSPSNGSVLKQIRSGERLVLTTCHPKWSAAKRLVITAERV